MTTIVGVVAVFLLWVAWWVYRGDKRHGKHRTTVAPTVAAHHTADRADALSVLKTAAAGADTRPAPPQRHTHRDPTTGRYTRKEQ